MRFSLRNRLGVPGILSVIALVLAMTGGALAAKGVIITKLSQISPSVQKKLKGNAGPPGAPGAQGAQGAQGPQGDPGPKGDVGAAGTSVTNSTEPKGANCEEGGTKLVGTATTYACNGKKGVAGKDGEPWAVGGLPSGATETGSWSFGPSTGAGGVYLPLTLPVPLADPLEGASHVHFINAAGKEVKTAGTEEVDSTTCLGSPAEPTAEPGNLCVYTTYQESFKSTSEGITGAGTVVEPGVSTAGAVLEVGITSAGAIGFGTFAVTAP